jgi:glycosyltransferase involved in cell wall biosynthesis
MQRRARVAVVAPAVPGREERNGFSARLHDFLIALIEVADVDLFLPRESDVDSPTALRYWRGFDAVSVHLVLDSGVRSPMVHKMRRVAHHLFGRLPRWSQPRRAPELARHLDEGRADVLCLHLPVTAHLAALAPADVPVVAVMEEGLERGILAPAERTWIHSAAAWRERRRVRWLYERTGERAALVIAISTEERARLGDAGIDRDRIVVVPHGIDVSYFAPDASVSESESGFEFDVAVFGDFHFARNLDPARDAARWAAVHEPALRWTFVGDIDDLEADMLRAAGVAVTGRVDDVRSYYAKAKVVLVPAVAVTGVKSTLVQAWAMGRPVVSTPESALGLPAVDGTNVMIGRTVPELVGRCAQLAASSEVRAALGDAGRRTAEDELDGAKIASEFASLVIAIAVVT